MNTVENYIPNCPHGKEPTWIYSDIIGSMILTCSQPLSAHEDNTYYLVIISSVITIAIVIGQLILCSFLGK
jgi:hypothetical protein